MWHTGPPTPSFKRKARRLWVPAFARTTGSRSAPLELERDLDLGAIGFDPALGVELHIELHDFGDAQFAQRFAGAVDRYLGGFFPGILAGADQFDDLVNAISHKRPPVVVRQDACCPCRPGSLTSRFHRRKAQSGTGVAANCLKVGFAGLAEDG